MSDLFRISILSDSLNIQFIRPSLIIGVHTAILISLSVVIVLILIYYFFLRNGYLKKYAVIPVKVEFGKDVKVECLIQRNEENIYIAHRIYIELVTRKAAIDLDTDHDILIEVYNSWYTIFGAIRDEIKSIPGSYLIDYKLTTSELTKLTIEILNNGLRPHLTKYQGEFRKWFANAIEDPKNKLLTPQQIQRQYPLYNELIQDMRNVNAVLKEYANQLNSIFTDGRIKNGKA
jgi:hypothetical protein